MPCVMRLSMLMLNVGAHVKDPRTKDQAKQTMKVAFYPIMLLASHHLRSSMLLHNNLNDQDPSRSAQNSAKVRLGDLG